MRGRAFSQALKLPTVCGRINGSFSATGGASELAQGTRVKPASIFASAEARKPDIPLTHSMSKAFTKEDVNDDAPDGAPRPVSLLPEGARNLMTPDGAARLR